MAKWVTQALPATILLVVAISTEWLLVFHVLHAGIEISAALTAGLAAYLCWWLFVETGVQQFNASPISPLMAVLHCGIAGGASSGAMLLLIGIMEIALVVMALTGLIGLAAGLPAALASTLASLLFEGAAADRSAN